MTRPAATQTWMLSVLIACEGSMTQHRAILAPCLSGSRRAPGVLFRTGFRSRILEPCLFTYLLFIDIR